jgi:hypothetical protein
MGERLNVPRAQPDIAITSMDAGATRLHGTQVEGNGFPSEIRSISRRALPMPDAARPNLRILQEFSPPTFLAGIGGGKDRNNEKLQETFTNGRAQIRRTTATN